MSDLDLSYGQLARTLKASVAAVREAVGRAGVCPHRITNSVPYFHRDDVAEIRAGLPNGDDLAAGVDADADFEIMAAEATILAAEEGGKLRRFHILAYTGGKLSLPSLLPDPLVIDLRGLTGADKSRPVLLGHDRTQLVGHTDHIVNDGRQLIATGLVSGPGEAAREVLDAADNKFPWQASIGAKMDARRFVKRGETVTVNGQAQTGPFNLIAKSSLREISFVVLGADDDTSARIAAGAARRGKAKMDPDPETDQLDDASAATAAEATRLRNLTKSAGKFRNEVEAGAIDRMMTKAVDEEWDHHRLELELLRASRPVAKGRRGGGQPDDALVIEASLCLSAGMDEKFVASQFDERIVDAAVTLGPRGASIHTLLFEVCRIAGKHVKPGRVDHETIRAAFAADAMIQADGFSTISLPGILGNVAHKSMLNSYQAVATTWQSFCAIESNSDFKAHTRYRMVGAGQYQPVPPSGELKHASLTEQSYQNTLATQGAIVALPRQMIINDDLGAFQGLPKILGRMGAICLEKAVFTLLLSNPSNFFHASNNNLLTGGGSALSIDALTLAEQKFLDATDPNGDPILVTPQTLLVPTALNVTASTITRSAEIRDPSATSKVPVVNPHAGRFTSKASPWLNNAGLTNHSATAWYLFASPADVAAMEVAFLNGQQVPTIESGQTDFSTLGMQWRSYHDFGTAMRDYRGAVKNNGA
jgi:hypothetical protein